MPRLYHLNVYTNLRKAMRNQPTPAEIVLWQLFRKRRFHGWKFRRQESIGRYIVDFFCPEKRLVIEVDGPIYDNPIQRAYDLERTEYLRACFIRVVRIKNSDVAGGREMLVKKLERMIFPPPPDPLPNSGGGGGAHDAGGGD